MDVDGSIVDFVTNVFFELGVLHALTQERRQSRLVKTEAILLSADFMCKTQRVEFIFNHHLFTPGTKKKGPHEGSRGSRELLILLAGARQIDIERYL